MYLPIDSSGPVKCFKNTKSQFVFQSRGHKFVCEFTLVYRIDVHAGLLILRKNPPCTALFWSARLLILRKNPPCTFICVTLKKIKSSKLKTAYNFVKKYKFPPCTFIDFPENFSPCTSILSCTFILSCMSIRYTRVYIYINK